MILRRVISHFRKQEWTAIALDFVIVVVGVFIGIQVSNWNGAQQDKREEVLIRERLSTDFQIIEQVIAEALRKALLAYDNEVQVAEQIFTQLRIHQSAYTPSYTRHFDYAIPAKEMELGNNWQPIGAYDLPAMLSDPDFRNAAHELREAQRFYFSWHQRNQVSSANVIALLDASASSEDQQ